MTQPLKKISFREAAVTVTRAWFQRERWLADSARAVGEALAAPAFFLAIVAVIIYVFFFFLPFLGAMGDRALNSRPEAYYVIPISRVSEADAKLIQGQLYADRVLDPRRESMKEGAPFFALNEESQQEALGMLERLRSHLMERARIEQEAALLRHGFDVLRSLRQGKSLEAAVAALPKALDAPLGPPAELAGVERLRQALSSAKRLSSADIPAWQLLIPRWLFSPAEGPAWWAFAQAGSGSLFGIWGLLGCIALGGLIAIGANVHEKLADAVEKNQERLRQEWERQSVERSAGSAQAPSKTTRL